jgi:glycosyltransferase involved in cell wall biosynthesis
VLVGVVGILELQVPIVDDFGVGLPEVLGDAALYFDPENVDDMAHVIEKVLLDGTLRSRLIDRGHAQVAKYSWLRMAEQTHQVYLDTLSR